MGVVATALMFRRQLVRPGWRGREFYGQIIPDVTVGKIELTAGPRDPSVALSSASAQRPSSRLMVLPHNFTFTPAMSIWIDHESEKELERVLDTFLKAGSRAWFIQSFGVGGSPVRRFVAAQSPILRAPRKAWGRRSRRCGQIHLSGLTTRGCVPGSGVALSSK